MIDWRDYLTADEGARLNVIVREKRALSSESKRLYDRARKRAKRNQEKSNENSR